MVGIQYGICLACGTASTSPEQQAFNDDAYGKAKVMAETIARSKRKGKKHAR
jgi:hypothetical protein